MAASVLSISKKLDEIDEGARDNRLGKLGRLLLFEPAHSERVEGGPVPPTWAELIWMTMIQKAIGGDVRAADWCASQAFGKPSSAVGMSLRSNNITIIDDMAPHTTDRPPGQNEPPLPSDVSEPQNSTLTPVNAPERD